MHHHSFLIMVAFVVAYALADRMGDGRPGEIPGRAAWLACALAFGSFVAAGWPAAMLVIAWFVWRTLSPIRAARGWRGVGESALHHLILVGLGAGMLALCGRDLASTGLDLAVWAVLATGLDAFYGAWAASSANPDDEDGWAELGDPRAAFALCRGSALGFAFASLLLS